MILSHLERTTVTVVLIGEKTAKRPWVRYEIEQSIARQNGLLGIEIHHLKDKDGDWDWFAGDKPDVFPYIPFPWKFRGRNTHLSGPEQIAHKTADG
jgi:hypothetical protein